MLAGGAAFVAALNLFPIAASADYVICPANKSAGDLPREIRLLPRAEVRRGYRYKSRGEACEGALRRNSIASRQCRTDVVCPRRRRYPLNRTAGAADIPSASPSVEQEKSAEVAGG
jgi:hypothetical protein